MIDALRADNASHIKVFGGGGGGVIVAGEIAELHACGVTRVYSAEDGQGLGLQRMIADMSQRCDTDLTQYAPTSLNLVAGSARLRSALTSADDARLVCPTRALARLLTRPENGRVREHLRARMHRRAGTQQTPTLGITGTGGAAIVPLVDCSQSVMTPDQMPVLVPKHCGLTTTV